MDKHRKGEGEIGGIREGENTQEQQSQKLSELQIGRLAVSFLSGYHQLYRIPLRRALSSDIVARFVLAVTPLMPTRTNTWGSLEAADKEDQC